MPAWTAFAGLAGVVLVLLLALAHLTGSQLPDGHASADTVPPPDSGTASDSGDAPVDGAPSQSPPDGDFSADEWHWGPDGPSSAKTGSTEATDESRESAAARGARDDGEPTSSRESTPPPKPTPHPEPTSHHERTLADIPTPALLANAALSQALFGGVLVVGAWWAEIPHAALGLEPVATSRLLVVGLVLGAALWVGNALAGRIGARFGVHGGEELRTLLAPETPGGWVLLLVGVLPVVALVEEVLFRATLVGALGAGFGLPAWVLVGGSSVAFALGHGAQGRVGMVVTGAFGLALGAAFVATGSLFVVVVAHYLVNALEFVVHEGLSVGE